ncbi:MAG: ABC transporter permease [Bacilli bacterium]|jgi:putative ABC transport system permease protein
MFLAWKELRHSKGKFSLIVALVALVAYLVYFLTALAYGLASSYTNGITRWGADQIVLTQDANDNIMMSIMGDDEYASIEATVDKARLGLFPAVVSDPDAEDPEATKEEVYTFGIDNGSFIAPDVTLGAYEAVADEALVDLGYELGDTLKIAGTAIEWTLIGFNSKSTYQTAPIVYVNLETWQEYRFGATMPVSLYSAAVIQGQVTAADDALQVYELQDFIQTLPGYGAQVLTFSIMIGFLILIVAFVLGIFIYVLTIQKTPMFGVMKAQGISNAYIGGSVVMQTLIITAFGIFIGLALTIVSGIFLGSVVPFSVNPIFFVGITLAFFLFSVTGGLFSVRTVLKIDPRIAIG